MHETLRLSTRRRHRPSPRPGQRAEQAYSAARFVFPDLDHRQWTALQHAVHKQQVDAVRVLLERGADPDARQDGATPLFIAADMSPYSDSSSKMIALN